MSTVRAMVCGAATLGAAACAWGDVASLGEVDGLAPLVERWHGMAEDIGLSGYSIGLVRDGELIAAEGFGVRDVGESADALLPVDPETMFYIASVTKTYLGAAIIKLADEGRLELDSPAKKYLPELRLADGSEDSVTVRDLLGHKRGLNSGNAVWLDAYTGHITDERYFHWLALEARSGDIDYTNVNYTLLGRIVERVTGIGWRDYLDQEVFTPGGMDRTTGYATELFADSNAAFPLVMTSAGELGRSSVIKNDAVMHAAGGLGTSALDGARWIEIQLGGGAAHGRRVMSERAMQEALAFQSKFAETDGNVRAIDGFAAGWQRGTWRRGEHAYYQHGGGYIGAAAHLSFIPDIGAGVVVLANLSPEGSAFGDMVSIDYYDHLLGVEDRRDLIPVYVNHLKEYRKRASDDAVHGPRLTSEHLSMPVRAYLGVYENEWLGTVEVRFEEGEIVGSIGNIPLRFVSPDGDVPTDSVGIETHSETLTARFETRAGRVAALVGALGSGDDEHRFERVAGGGD